MPPSARSAAASAAQRAISSSSTAARASHSGRPAWWDETGRRGAEWARCAAAAQPGVKSRDGESCHAARRRRSKEEHSRSGCKHVCLHGGWQAGRAAGGADLHSGLQAQGRICRLGEPRGGGPCSRGGQSVIMQRGAVGPQVLEQRAEQQRRHQPQQVLKGRWWGHWVGWWGWGEGQCAG